MCVYMAGTISPLVILSSTTWSTLPIGRDHLLTVCHPFFFCLTHNSIPSQALYALGNQCPAPLREAEDEFWNAMMRVVCGSKPETELTSFLAKFAEMKQRWQDEGTDMQLDFFKCHEHPFCLISNSLHSLSLPKSLHSLHLRPILRWRTSHKQQHLTQLVLLCLLSLSPCHIHEHS